MIRRALADEAFSLFELEKQASTAALSHIFGPDIAFPDEDVLARWRLVLEEPGMTVLVDEEGGQAVGYAAFADGWLRHLGVLPAWWGTGRAAALHDAALAGLGAQGAATSYLWVLAGNHRARAFYRRQGWTETSICEEEVFAPYPTKIQMRRSRRGGR